MKKLSFIAILMVFVTLFACGCNNSTNQSQSQNSSVESAVEVLPTYNELFEINSYAKILEKHENFHLRTVRLDGENNENFVEEVIFMQGEGKVDYHMKNGNVNEGCTTSLSRIGNAWYYQTPSIEEGMASSMVAVMEMGEVFHFDYTLPDILSGEPVGDGSIEDGKIVYRTVEIIEASEYNEAFRYESVYYFNAQTKLIEKSEQAKFDADNVLVLTYRAEFTYDVKIEDYFEETLKGRIYSSEKRIDLEIIFDYNTPLQKSYNFVATTDAQTLVVVGYNVFQLYADAECTNLLTTLESLDGQSSATVYAKPMYPNEE